MGFLLLLLALIQPASAIEGTYIYRGNMDAPYHSVSFSPIKSLTHLAQDNYTLKYHAEQTAIVDGISFTPVTYIESADSVKVTLGQPGEGHYHEFLVTKTAVKKIN